MKKLSVLAAALALLVGSWRHAQAAIPCICRGAEYEKVNATTSNYFAALHEEDCENFMLIIVQDAPDLPGQTCPDCDDAFLKAPTLAANKDDGKSSGSQVQNKKLPLPKQKKDKTFVPKGKGFEAEPFAIVKFWLQGDDTPCYVKVFNVRLFDVEETKEVEKSRVFKAGFEIEAVPDNEPGLIEYDYEHSIKNVRPLKFKSADDGVIIVPQQYVVKVGLVEYTVLATR